MSAITQKQLIEKIKTLKEIKPRKEWAVLLKSQILAEKQVEVSIPAEKVGIFDTLSYIFFQRKLAYSFTVILFLAVGVFGFATYTMPGDLLFPVKKIAENSQAALTGQTMLKQDVATFTNRINDLNQLAKAGKIDNIPSAISEINDNASELVKNLKDVPVKNLQTIKEIAISLKTLSDVPGADLTENSNVKDLYQIIVQSQIDDLQETTLTDEQKKTLEDIKDLYNQGKYTDALEKILLINK
jgi:hypothetical protein